MSERLEKQNGSYYNQDMEPNKILRTSVLAGRILLESGAETIRVEETVTKICESFQVEDASAFATPTGLFVSFDFEHQTHAKVLRIIQGTIHLEKINLVNDVSRQCSMGCISLDEAYTKLKQINRYVGYSNIEKLIASSFAAMFFAYLFGAVFIDGIWAFVIGFLVQLSSVYLTKLKINFIVRIMILSALLTFLAATFTYFKLATNMNLVITGSVMLLVPGVAITNALRDLIAGDLLSGITKTIEAFLISISIAIGVWVVLTLWIAYVGGI